MRLPAPARSLPAAALLAAFLLPFSSRAAAADPGASLPLSPHGSRADGPPLRWKGKSHRTDRLPSSWRTETTLTVRSWLPWSLEHGYRMGLSRDERVLLLVDDARRSISPELELVEDALAALDAALPGSPESDVDSDADGDAERPTCVVLALRDRDDYRDLLDVLAAAHDALVPWASAAREAPGFVLAEPLVACWIEHAEGQEEWDPHGELAHRVARLATLREHGTQPWWLETGLAWHVEESVTGGLHCFPGRDSFVAASEHADWPRLLRERFRERDAEPPRLEPIAAWPRGSFQLEPATTAFGLVRFMAAEHAEALPAILADLAALWESQSRDVRPDGSWSRILGYELPAADQRRVLAAHLGEDFEARLGRFLAAGGAGRAR